MKITNSGNPIVLIHGLFGNLSTSELLASFDESNVHAPDLIGYGRYSGANTDDLSLENQAEHVTQFIQQKFDQKVDLAGHSVGGAVAALVASHSPDLIASYTSIEGNFTLKDAFWSSQIAEKPISMPCSQTPGTPPAAAHPAAGDVVFW